MNLHCCRSAALLIKKSPVVRILCSLHFWWVPKVVRSTLLHFSQLDGPLGKNSGFYEFVCICTFNCEIKAALLEDAGQLTIVILVHLLSFHGWSSFIRVDAETASCKGKVSICIVAAQGLPLLRRALGLESCVLCTWWFQSGAKHSPPFLSARRPFGQKSRVLRVRMYLHFQL